MKDKKKMLHTMILSVALACYDTRLQVVLPFFLDLRRCGTGIEGITAQVNSQKAPNNPAKFIGVYCNLLIDALLLTGRRNLDTPGDYLLIAGTVNQLLSPAGLSILDMAVYRIDYCYNAYVLDRWKRELLMRLFRKCDLSGGSLRVEKYSDTHPQADPGLNDAYFHNRRRTVQLYDKETERRDKSRPVLPHEEGVLRLEYQTLFDEIKAAGKLGFWDWANDDMAYAQLSRCAALFFAGDFYSLRAADRKLERAGLSRSMREKLHGYMVAVARYGLRRASDFCKPAPITQATARNYRAILETNGICPVTIPKSCGVSHMENPFRRIYAGKEAAA